MTTTTEHGQRRPRFWGVPVLALSALVLGVLFGYRLTTVGPADQAPVVQNATVIPNPRPLKPFSLRDHNDRPFSNAELEGHWTFIFFGYTHCPDVCPTTLATLNQASQLLEQDQSEQLPRFVFVSVDPERDSLQSLASYASYFNSRFVGITGTQPALQALTGQLGILYIKVDSKPTASDYLMDHSASVMLNDPQGRLHAVFSAPHHAEAIANDFRAIRQHYE